MKKKTFVTTIIFNITFDSDNKSIISTVQNEYI